MIGDDEDNETVGNVSERWFYRLERRERVIVVKLVMFTLFTL